MIRMMSIAVLGLVAFGGISSAGGGDCCEQCGCKLHCQEMCEWATRQVPRYKAAHTECPPPSCVCCDDRWIIGCPKPIKILNLKHYFEEKKYLVRRYVVRTCPQCHAEDSVSVK